MLKNYLFLLIFSFSFLNSFSQSDCSGAQAYIVYALSNSNSALEANNLTHAKYYAAKAKESFENVQESLKDCQCDQVDDFVYDAIAYLSKAESAEKKEKAYYYAQKGKELAQATIEKLDRCTMTGSGSDVSSNTTYEADELSSIAKQQEQLKQQQLALQQKQAELKQQLIQKEAQELTLKKEVLISKMTSVVKNNIRTFNDALKNFNCTNEILEDSSNQIDLNNQSLESIRLHFINILTELSSEYTLKLKSCI
ncbi:hypothetical protein BZARG_1401 [Bizionia argentinensis JUB59]|uniref:DUF4398 domain-containing protein n=1 Tax=Bizionia argentinensis JUB59 TaxID=1046627 RepID=G2EBX7_9FLAO|nr:hypothetical protein [Bizionia argentinensis]EGV43996.1 hypothetical protein BZARG_1401 [Bizionia argentinensis JUB59]